MRSEHAARAWQTRVRFLLSDDAAITPRYALTGPTRVWLVFFFLTRLFSAAPPAAHVAPPLPAQGFAPSTGPSAAELALFYNFVAEANQPQPGPPQDEQPLQLRELELGTDLVRELHDARVSGLGGEVERKARWDLILYATLSAEMRSRGSFKDGRSKAYGSTSADIDVCSPDVRGRILAVARRVLDEVFWLCKAGRPDAAGVRECIVEAFLPDLEDVQRDRKISEGLVRAFKQAKVVARWKHWGPTVSCARQILSIVAPLLPSRRMLGLPLPLPCPLVVCLLQWSSLPTTSLQCLPVLPHLLMHSPSTLIALVLVLEYILCDRCLFASKDRTRSLLSRHLCCLLFYSSPDRALTLLD